MTDQLLQSEIELVNVDSDPPNSTSAEFSRRLKRGSDDDSSSRSYDVMTLRALRRRRGFRRPNRRVVRTSHSVDVETGEVGVRQCHVEHVQSHDEEAMDPKERRWNRFASRLGVVEEENENMDKEEENRAEDESEKRERKHFRLTAGKSATREDYYAQHSLLVKYLHWTFRTSFLLLFTTSTLAFWTFTILWACLFHAVGHAQPECISVGGLNYTAAGENFMDAYALSWTTFSTVGYGLVYPQLAFNDGSRCFGANMLATLESFIGVLFASFVGAIVYGKITRTQSVAPTLFSDPMVIRYGPGVMAMSEDENEDSGNNNENRDAGTKTDKSTQIPCPVLEFRVVNLMHAEPKSEIVDATIKVTASILERDAAETIRLVVEHPSHHRRQRNVRLKAPQFLKMPQKQIGKFTSSIAKSLPAKERIENAARNMRSSIATPFLHSQETDSVYDPDDHMKSVTRNYAPSTDATTRLHSIIDEGDGSAQLVPRRIFSSLSIETPSHPFFKRVWNVRHTLDHTSPLLSEECKKMIMDNNGFWPEALNNYTAVEEHVRFDQIIVSFSGTSNGSGSTVYAQHVYEHCDLNIGYRFAGILRQLGGRLAVDVALVNDVMEQSGGGGKPFADIANANDISDDIVDAREKAAKAANAMATTSRAVAKFLALRAPKKNLLQTLEEETMDAETEGGDPVNSAAAMQYKDGEEAADSTIFEGGEIEEHERVF